jgi:uncharacterized protein (TIGR03089 family)
MAGQFDGALWPLINQRVRNFSGQPFVTSIDAAGFRTELSGVTLLNAVAKNAGALVDEGDLEPGSTIAMHLPWHWQRITWTLAAWTIGAVVIPFGDVTTADLVITDRVTAATLIDADEPWVVSLHPLGLVEAGLPAEVIDATGLSRMQPDALLVEPASGDGRALALGSASYTRIEAMTWVSAEVPTYSDRVLINAPAANSAGAWLIPTLFPLLGSGAVVMTDTENYVALAEQEGVTQIWQ